MNNYQLMMQARLLALAAQLEEMKADNQVSALNQQHPKWSGDHFAGLSSDALEISAEVSK